MGRKRTSGATDDQVIEAYDRLNSTPKVAAELGLGVTTVLRVIQRRGIARDGFKRYLATRTATKGEPYIGEYKGSTEEILEMYRSGLSLKVIAEKIGRSVHVVARRVRKAGIVRGYQTTGPEHSMWKGGRILVNDYWQVWVADDDPFASMRNARGYILEHRLVMARKLGRPLLSTESVHHIDGNRGRNDPENLQLRQGKHGANVVMCCLNCGSFNIGHTKIADAKPAE